METKSTMMVNNTGQTTKMTRVWKSEDSFGRLIYPSVPRVEVSQGNNVVVLDEEHLRIALKKWFSG